MEEKTKSILKEFVEFIRDLVIIFLIVLFIRSYLVLPFQISGQSMYESYYDRQFIIVDRLSYHDIPFVWSIKDPKRWDAVVFNTHLEWREYFIKRIIWLPWETIIIEWWEVFVKTLEWEVVKLDERYLSKENYSSTFVRWSSEEHIFEIPENSYFVLWDNRNASTDSRTCLSSCSISWTSHFIDREDIIGRVFIDLGYFSFREMWFRHPNLWISTSPRWFSSPSSFDYNL